MSLQTGWKPYVRGMKKLEYEWYVIIILEPFLGNFEIQTATLSRIYCEFEFYFFILGLPCVKEKVSTKINE